jgi:hypothetical protein
MRCLRGHKKPLLCLQIIVTALAFTVVAQGAGVIIGADVPGTSDIVFQVGSVITGESMAALGSLFVQVNFSDGTNSGLKAWTSCGSGTGCGFATGTVGNGAWTLTETGDTGAIAGFPPNSNALDPWTLTNTASTSGKDIQSVQLFGGAGIIFDRDRAVYTSTSTGGQEGTPGGSFGIDYTFASESGGTFTATVVYSNEVQLKPAVPCNGAGFPGSTVPGCGDEWQNLTFTFTTGTFRNTGSGSSVFAFFQDTDQANPEPATFAMIGGGLIVLAVARKRLRARKAR